MSFDEEKTPGSESEKPTQSSHAPHEEVEQELMEALAKLRSGAGASRAAPAEASPNAPGAVNAGVFSDEIFQTIEATKGEANERMGHREILVQAKVTNQLAAATSSGDENEEVVRLPAGAAIALVTGAEVAHQWKNISPEERETFRRGIMERLAQEIEAVNLDFRELMKNPVWHAVFATIVEDEINQVDTVGHLTRKFHPDILGSNGTFTAQAFPLDDAEAYDIKRQKEVHDLQVAEIVKATLQRLERFTQEIHRRPKAVYPYESSHVVQELYCDCIKILGKETFQIMYPGGNPTCLIAVTPDRLQSERDIFVDKAAQLVKAGLVEQVGFFFESDDPKDAHDLMLEMSGGEFCLNGICALAALHYAEATSRPTHAIRIQCSGAKKPVQCECHFNQDNTVGIRAIYPVAPDFDEIQEGTIVHLPGISYFVFEVNDENVLSEAGENELRALMATYADKFQGVPAIGLIRFYKDDDGLIIAPTVYVRKTDTLVEESACGSGTVATTCVMVEQARAGGDSQARQWEVRQPSMSWLTSLYRDKGSFPTPAIIVKTSVRRVCGSDGPL